MFDITFLYSRTNGGQGEEDSALLKEALGGTGCTFRSSHPFQPPVTTDLAFHFEVPVPVWMPWAARNILLVTGETVPASAAPVAARLHLILCTKQAAADAAVAAGIDADKVRVVPWATTDATRAALTPEARAEIGRIVGQVRSSGAKRTKHLPPPLQPADCPRISVVTLLHNRRKFFDLACHSLMIQDYPKDKIEWIIVEDSTDPAEDASDRVMAVAAAAAPVRVEYVPLPKKTPIGKKRNIGVEKATADIVLMMDDDDHYPETSFRRRVAWLTQSPWGDSVDCAACGTVACYDLLRGISAINEPPLDLPFEKRVSEATLTFRKSFWAERGGFPADVNVGEGELFLRGQGARALEIPPQQIVVAFSHGKNVGNRGVPSEADVKPGCLWGFPREFLEFLHGLVGVKVVADKAA